ncbi:MAG: phytanoyl-CoA dioxygenase family protein [Kofleriaceae bacterium]
MTSPRLATLREQGYVVLERFVTPSACEALRARAARLVEDFDERAHRSIFTTVEQARRTDDYFLDSAERIHCFFEEEAFEPSGALRQPKARSINKIGHALHDLDPVFDAFSRAPEVKALVEELALPEPRLMQSMYIFKQPRIGGEVRCHQDATYLHTEPQRLLGLWFALEDATVENGCLWAIPGGHRGGLRERFVREGRRTRKEVLDVRPWDERALVPLELPQGGLIVLDGLVPHRSDANRSARSRHAYALHVVSGHDAYLKTNWLQRSTAARGF